ncbi:hypothetical protein ACLOJK_025116 [Asimina triloba]
MGGISVARFLMDERNPASGHENDYHHSFEASDALAIGGKVLFAAIIAVFLTVVLVVGLHLYARCFLYRRDLRSRSRRGWLFAPDSAANAAAVHCGLEPSVILSIPVVSFSPEKFEDGLECAVCLSELSEGEKARVLPNCNHGFHVDCIDMWLHSHSTCPLCRNPVVSESTDPNSAAAEAPAPEADPESLVFPTNVLIWGTEDNVRTGSSGSKEGTSASAKPAENRTLVIDIPSRRLSESVSSSSIRVPDGELSSPALAQLRSLKRLLSRGKRALCSPRGGDIEEGSGNGEVVPSPKTVLES